MTTITMSMDAQTDAKQMEEARRIRLRVTRSGSLRSILKALWRWPEDQKPSAAAIGRLVELDHRTVQAHLTELVRIGLVWHEPCVHGDWALTQSGVDLCSTLRSVQGSTGNQVSHK